MSKIIRVAAYIRVSTEDQAIHGESLPAQEENLIQFAKANNMRIIKIYRDEGHSARKPALKRPVVLELLEDVKAGKIDRIIFIKLDRWFRNVREYHKMQEILEKNNVTWQATMEDYNTATADGRLKVNIMISVAENESDRTSERIKFVFNAKRQRKEYCFTGAYRPYGYMPQVIDGVKRCVKDPEKEPIVKDFWDYVLNYNSIRKAGMFCNEKYGIDRHYKTWMQMSRNELYTGTYYGVEGYTEPYISREDWRRIMSGHETIKKTQRPERVYLFTGLIRCPCCGYTLKGTFKTYPNDRSIEYKSYRCNRGKLNVCEYHSTVSEKKVEKYLLGNVREELEQFVGAAEVHPSVKKKRNSKGVDIAKLNEQLRRLNVIFIAGNISDAEYETQTKHIKAEIEKAREQENDNKPIDITALRAFLSSDFEAMYQNMSKEDQRRMWRSIIKEIHVDGPNVSGVVFRT